MKRLVSVVVPSRDRPAFLREALASIWALAGDDLEFEILVGDNGSGTATREVAAEFGARYFRVGRNGAGAARNAGLAAATGAYIAFLDDDDVWLPNHIRGHLALLEAQPELDAVVGQVISTDPGLTPTGVAWPADLPRDGQLFRHMLAGYFPQIGATLVRTRVRESVGQFDETLLGDQDWDWQIRVARRHQVGFFPEPCILFRQRAPGSFDALQLARVRFTRRVFLRHAVPAWRSWDSPLQVLRAYSHSLRPTYEYFVQAAVERSEGGDRRATLNAIAGAVRVLPVRGLTQLVSATPLRGSLLSLVQPRNPA